MRRLLLLFLFLSPVLGQTADVPLSDDVALYRMYHTLTPGGPYTEIAQIPVTDPLARPVYTDPAVDFSGGAEHFYVVTAQNIPGLESGFSNELRVKLPQVPGKLKIDRSP